MADPITITPQDRIVDPARPAGAPQQPVLSSVERASEAARATLAAKGTAVPPEPPARNPGNGQFVEPGRVDTARPVPEPPAGQAPPAIDPAAPKVPAAPPVDETPEAKQAREAAEAAAAAAADPDAVVETPEEKEARELEERTVLLPGRNNTEYEFVAPDAETANVLRQLKNASLRGEEIAQARAEIEQRGQEFEALETVLEANPTGFVLDRLANAPEQLDHLVLYLATRPEVFARIGAQLRDIATNPVTREMIGVKQENKALNMEREVANVTEERAAVRQNLEDVRTTVMSLIPAEMSEEQAAILFKDSLRDLRDYANRHDLQTLPTRDIPALLAARLTAYGINPVEAAARAADAATRRGAAPTRRPAPASPRVPAAAPAKPAVPAPTGKQLVMSAKKKGAAALPPAGAGSPPATTPMTPPKNADGSSMSIEQRLAWHKQQVAAGSRRL